MKELKIYKMKKIVFLIIFIVLGFVSCKSSYTKIGDKNANYIPYYLKVYEADSLYLTGSFQSSYEILDSLFKKYEPINIDGYYEYEIYTASAVMSNNLKDIKRKFKTAHKKYGSKYAQGLNGNAIRIRDSIVKYDSFSDNDIDKFIKNYINKLNLSLRDKVAKMNKEDSSVRGNFNSEEGQQLYKEKHRKELLQIFDKYGYPEKSIIGHNNLNLSDDDQDVTLEIILIHQSTEFKEYILPFILKSVKEGKVSPEVYAVIYDRMYWEKSKKAEKEAYQYYGSHLGGNLKIRFPKKLDSIRMSIGLYKNPNYGVWRNNKIFNN